MAIWDTARHSNSIVPADQIAQKSGWKKAEGDSAKIAGDACMVNEYLVVVFRKGARGAECYYRLGDTTAKVMELVPVSGRGARARRLESCKVIKNAPDQALLEARFTAASGSCLAVRYLLRQGKPFLETLAGEDTRKIWVEARTKYAVLPDLFAGDLVVGANQISLPQVRFPSEHVLLQLLEDQNAIVMTVWRSNDQQVTLNAERSGDGKVVSGAEIEYGKEKDLNVWVAVLAAPAIWHEKKIAELDPIKDRQLDWKVPFRALWRADYPRQDGLCDSWKCVIKKPNGEYECFGVSVNKARTASMGGRGKFAYPACVDNDRAYLRNTQYEDRPDLKYDLQRSVVIYPFQAIERSPANIHGVVEVLREALKDTPQASLHEDIRVKRMPRDKYPATCGVTGEYEKIFDAREEKAKKAHLLERLGAMSNFVLGIRSRINEYLDWGKKTREFCARTKADKPPLADLVDELDAIVAKFDKVYENHKLDERTPGAARVLIEKLIALIDSNEAKKDEKAKEIGRATRTIGGNQDSAIAKFRLLTKQLRQRAGYRMLEAKDNAAFEFAREIRQRTAEMLRCGFNHEGAFAD